MVCRICGIVLGKRNKVYCSRVCLYKGLVGIKRSPEQCERLSKLHKGKTISKEHRKAISIKIKGRKESLETRIKKSIAIKAAKAHLVKPNRTTKEEKDLIRKSFEYRNWRMSVFERDKFKCQMPGCETIERYIEANHIMKFSDYPELRFDINNGITLCKPCHKNVTGREYEFTNLFKQIICRPL